jgi:predicted nucleotidyltransferase
MPTLTGLARIREACHSHPITLVYLFGSHARGTADKDSDIDLAVLADASVGKPQRNGLRLRLMRQFAEALDVPIEKIDVVILQEAPALLEQNVIRQGRLLFAINPAVPRTYEADAALRFANELPSLEREAKLTVERILARSA